VAHADIDLANARANRGNAGFLPEEREWVDLVLSRGFVDAFRQFEPGGGHYTWWSMRQGVRERNVGWRLDYAFVDPSLRDRLVSCRHLAERRGSDHCPVEVEIDTSFV
jgi:exodeoxyribonuclease-3